MATGGTAWHLLLGALLLSFATAAVAGPAPGDEPEAEPDGAADEAAPMPAADEDEPSGPSPEVFVPSEDISEDFAVPFPVDI